MTYADVILPLPFSEKFTYAVPELFASQIQIGTRVVVPFGRNKTYTAIIFRIHSDKPKEFTPKEIHSLIDAAPIVNKRMLQLWEWISFYYMAPLGDVYRAALPASLKQAASPKLETVVCLNENIDAAQIDSLLGRAKKQHSLLHAIRTLLKARNTNQLPKKTIQALPEYSASVFNGLVQKNILQQHQQETSRLDSEKAQRSINALNVYQREAFDKIKETFKEKKVCLLHGITSSGKTEIYIHLIAETIQKGNQALYLVPEIALTTQLTERLKAVFGNRLGIYHSKINDNVRAEIWQKMQSDNPYDVIIGVRSSIFLPFGNLQLIIVDEEHETSYKQQDPAPRYHARDTAIVLATMYGANTLLGSATPSVESFYNALNGKYGLVTLTKRFEDMELPHIELVDTKELYRKRKMKSILAPCLIEKITEALANHEQIILFRNRRGFAPILECKACGWTPKCNQCDVSLTYHKKRNRLLCHYCNAVYHVPEKCPKCNEEKLEFYGQGAEQVEDEVARLFPDASVARMDTDSTRSKDSYQKIIHNFEQHKIDILVGTQMLAKGLDFANVSVVGIIAADGMLNLPDFRSHERAFQLITQASGRAGRKHKRGSVFIQTGDPHQPFFEAVKRHDYDPFFIKELAERKTFHYPPYFRIIAITLKHKREALAAEAATLFTQKLRNALGERVMGPHTPPVGKIQNYYLQRILLKIERHYPAQSSRNVILDAERALRNNAKYKYVTIQYDADPM